MRKLTRSFARRFRAPSAARGHAGASRRRAGKGALPDGPAMLAMLALGNAGVGYLDRAPLAD